MGDSSVAFSFGNCSESFFCVPPMNFSSPSPSANSICAFIFSPKVASPVIRNRVRPGMGGSGARGTLVASRHLETAAFAAAVISRSSAVLRAAALIFGSDLTDNFNFGFMAIPSFRFVRYIILYIFFSIL